MSLKIYPNKYLLKLKIKYTVHTHYLMFDQILDWETPTQKRQVGLDLQTHLRRLLAFTYR